MAACHSLVFGKLLCVLHHHDLVLACQGVIGAGAAGLVAARELAREGHQPTVFEQGSRSGGVWVYTDAVEEANMLGKILPVIVACMQIAPSPIGRETTHTDNA